MDLDTAINEHTQWKMKLRAAIADKAHLDSLSIGKDNNCPLGQWLHGEAKTKYGHLTTYKECLSAHASFHREAGRVAHLINQQHYDQAAAALAAGTPYISASSLTGVAINKLKKEVVA